MLIRVVRMTFKESKVDEFLENFEANKEKIRNFPGCHHLELWQDENDQHIFLTYSHWENEEALNQYRDSELFKSVWAVTKALFAGKPFAFSSKKIYGTALIGLARKRIFTHICIPFSKGQG